jgi:hypothetical protein
LQQERFVLDIISAFPWDIAISHVNLDKHEFFLLLKLLYIRRLIGILKTNPIYHYMKKSIQQLLQVGSSFMSIFIFGFILLLFLHYHACLIFFMGKITFYESLTWADPKLHNIKNYEFFSQYVWAFFASMANTFPMSGFVPIDFIEQIITIIATLVGAMLYAALVGTISAFSLGLDSSGRKFREKIDEVNEFMEHRHLSKEVKEKVRKFYNLKFHGGKYFDKDAIMRDMNHRLRQVRFYPTIRNTKEYICFFFFFFFFH